MSIVHILTKTAGSRWRTPEALAMLRGPGISTGRALTVTSPIRISSVVPSSSRVMGTAERLSENTNGQFSGLNRFLENNTQSIRRQPDYDQLSTSDLKHSPYIFRGHDPLRSPTQLRDTYKHVGVHATPRQYTAENYSKGLDQGTIGKNDVGPFANLVSAFKSHPDDRFLEDFALEKFKAGNPDVNSTLRKDIPEGLVGGQYPMHKLYETEATPDKNPYVGRALNWNSKNYLIPQGQSEDKLQKILQSLARPVADRPIATSNPKRNWNWSTSSFNSETK